MTRHRFLEATANLFEETGEFPPVKSVQRELESWRDKTNARHEAARLPRSLGTVKGEQVFLSVRGVERAERGSRVLERFPAGLREALAIYRGRDRREVPTISVADLIRRAEMSESLARQVLQLLAAEKLVTKVRAGVWEVLPSVRHYRSVRTVDDYLTKKRVFERRRCRRSAFRKPLDVLRAALGKEGAVRAVIIATAGILLAALTVWAVNNMTGGSGATAPVHHPPPAHVARPPQGP